MTTEVEEEIIRHWQAEGDVRHDEGLLKGLVLGYIVGTVITFLIALAALR